MLLKGLTKYLIRMIILWYMLVLSARCSGSDEIPLDRAELSSTYGTSYSADRAIDNDLVTRALTDKEDPAWLRVYFKSSSEVERVEIKKGFNRDNACSNSVSVYKGEVRTLCGTYTKPRGIYSETVQCGGKRGDSVMLEMTGCKENKLQMYEIQFYYPGRHYF